MNLVYLTSRSVTYAQRMEKVLRKNGISAAIERPEIKMTEQSCAYAVVISQGYLPEALEILRRRNLMPVKVIVEENGELRALRI